MNDRLVSPKKRWARKQIARGLSPLREASDELIPPGQHVTKGFPVLDLGVKPEVPLGRWRLRIDGRVENPVELDWDRFSRLPRVEDVSNLHCVTTWSKLNCRWEGVPFTVIHKLVRPLPKARYVFFTSYDDYTVNVPLDTLLDDDVLIATHFEGKPLPLEHGAPARVIIPKLYGWKGAKFVRRIHFMEEDRLGYWEVRGYSNTADPFTEDRYAT